jgi:hypothetical protein
MAGGADEMSYDRKCYDLAIHFFGDKDPRLQEIQDAVESFPSDHDGEIAKYRLESAAQQSGDSHE